MYIGGYFNPNKIIINNFEIKAPQDMIIYSLESKNNNYILGLPFFQKSSYILNTNQKIRFTMIDRGFFKKESKSISFELSSIALKRFNNRLKYADKKDEFRYVDTYDEACKIYSRVDKTNFYTRIYDIDKKLAIYIYSNIKIDDILKKLCG